MYNPMWFVLLSKLGLLSHVRVVRFIKHILLNKNEIVVNLELQVAYFILPMKCVLDSCVATLIKPRLILGFVLPSNDS